jgi:Leucine-rich repeat (LRR) protein
MEFVTETLNLTGISGICIEEFDFPNLRELCLSGCKLKQYPNLKQFPNLIILDVSNNGIYELGDAPKSTLNLKRLDLSSNFIVNGEHIRVLYENLSMLQILDLRFNPINTKKGYRSMIISMFENLKILDCQEIFATEKVLL